ncbi:MAG: hypothetical protein K5920_06105 [Bacteroidales bacterium]|nr:hypothetical protein [Bacteroidales bacterium]
MNENLKKIEHVIGIDLGHGETSAAICSLQWDTSVEQLEPVKDLKLSGNKAVIPSAITFLDDGSARVGDSAFNTELLKKAKVHVGFKRKPENVSGEAEQTMIRFMKEVYNRIRFSYAGILTDGNHLVYIATPSGWDKDTKQLYVRMAQIAGLPTPNDGVTSESRAAFVKAQHDATLLLGRSMDKGAIVFDMGSSTLDFTYMNTSESLDHPIDNGYNCGASYVEKTIFEKLEKENESIRLFESKYPELRDYLLFEVRKFKEEVYTKPNERIRKTYNFEDFIDDVELEDERFKIAFMPGELDQVLEEVGYIESIRNALVDFKNNYISGKQINGVLLTGGASRMTFIKKLVCDCWGLKEDQVHYDIDPSLTISRGVAEVARMDLRTGGMEKGLEQEIKDLEDSDDIYNTFVDKFSLAYKDELATHVKSSLERFASSETDLSLNDLQEYLNAAPKRAANAMTINAARILQDAVKTNLSHVEEVVEDICKHYSQQGMDVNVSYNVSIPQLSSVDVNGLTDAVVANVISSDEIGHFIGTAGLAVGGGLMAALFSGPVAWITAGSILAFRWLFGESDEERKKRLMAEKMIKVDRENKKNEVLAALDQKITGVDVKIKEVLKNNTKMKQAVKSCVAKTLQSYRENLKAARILID